MPNDTLDPRLTAARPDLADVRLRGRVEADRFVEGESRRVRVSCAPLRRRPDADSGLDTEAVMGDPVTLYEEKGDFAFVRLNRDGYVGYLPAGVLGAVDPAPTHRVTALRTFLYPAADMKRPAVGYLGLGASFAAEAQENGFVKLVSGTFVFADHVLPPDRHEPDYVATAERLIGTPYLWGGRTSLGLDCSGLVQLSLQMAGLDCPRDTDMQEHALGELVSDGITHPSRGDFVFWKGHVGLMLDSEQLIHANGHHMAVAVEPLREAVSRIETKSFGAVTSVRRLKSMSCA